MSVPKVYVSKCLGFCACWWNGTVIFSDFVEQIKPYVDIVTHCPEVELGLGSPRKFVRIVMVDGEKRFVQPATGRDLTEQMNEYVKTTVASLEDLDGIILRENSPSCSIKSVKYYTSPEPGSSITGTGPGLFASAMMEKFQGVPTESDGRLRNLRIREDFLSKLFLFSSFREVAQSRKMGSLVDFHSDNKYLLMAHGQKHSNALGNIVANREKHGIDQVLRDYGDALTLAIQRTPRRGSVVNVFSKIFGYYSKELKGKEKEFFLAKLEAYRKGRANKAEIREILRVWNLRFENEYLQRQTIFEPYPEELEESCGLLKPSKRG